MKHLITSFPLLLLFCLSSNAQNNDRATLVENKVHISSTFIKAIKVNGEPKKGKDLIEKKTYNSKGFLLTEEFYEKGEISWERHLSYSNDDQVKSVSLIKGGDTTVTHYQRDEYVEIITGGIPDYFPKIEYYPNGLKKSETTFGNGKEFLLEYEYTAGKNW